MKRLPLFFVVYIIILTSCLDKTKKKKTYIADEKTQIISNNLQKNSESIEHLNLFDEHTNFENRLSVIASKVKFIQLDNVPPLNSFFVYDIGFSGNHIFLSSIKYIYQYNIEGEFIKQIGSHGQGPKEYIQLYPPLQIDRNFIYALDDRRNQILIYDFNGVFQRTISIDQKSDSFEIIDSTTIALRQMDYHRFMPNCNQICFVDFKGNPVKSYPSKLYPLPKKRFQHYGASTSFLWRHRDDIFSLEYGADTIYRIIKDSLIPTSVISGNLRLDDDEYFRKEVGKNKLEIFPYLFRPNSGIFESNKYILFRMISEKERFFSIYDKETKEFSQTFHKDAPATRTGSLKMDYFIDDMVTGLPFNPQYQSEENAIGFISAADIYDKKQEILDFVKRNRLTLPENIETIVKNIKEEDNDVIMVVQFK